MTEQPINIRVAAAGRTRSAEEWELGLVDLAVLAGGEVLDAGGQPPDAIITANALGDALGDQRNLALHAADRLGLHGVETLCVSCDEASGGSAIRQAIALLLSGFHQRVLVIGAEKTSDALPDQLEAVRATGLDAAQEASFGFSPTVAAALGMGRYLEHHGLARELFYHPARIAHAHGAKNRLGIFAWPLTVEQYLKSPVVATPLTVCDNAPLCDGAAAVMLTREPGPGVHITGSASVCARRGISAPVVDLSLPAARESARAALARAGLTAADMACFELHDSSSFLAVLSMEAVGLAPEGRALLDAQQGAFDEGGQSVLWVGGGHKSRGHAPGAGGVFQLVEAALALQGRLDVRLSKKEHALVQCLGSFGALAVTHVLTVR